MRFRDRAVLFLATGGGVGNLPFAPGTFGSLWGIPITYLCSKTDTVMVFLSIAALTAAAIWLATEAEKILGAKDARPIVVDEIAGFLVTLFGLPVNLFTLVAGFFLFRVMDIAKPFPIRHIERRVPKGAGVVLDDVAAGIYGNLLLRGILAATEGWG